MRNALTTLIVLLLLLCFPQVSAAEWVVEVLGPFNGRPTTASAVASVLALGAVAMPLATAPITEFPVEGGPYAITAGPDGNVWFSSPNENQIGRIAPAGVITMFVVPTANACGT